jgi:outer membrane protein TolC
MNMPTFTIVFGILVTAFLGVPPASSQDLPPLRLTLRDAVRLALKQNPQIRIANLKLAEGEQDHAIARSALLPQASFGVDDSAERINLGSSFGAHFPGIPHHSGPFEVFQSGPSFSMPIFDLTLWRNWQASHQEVKAREADDETVREETVSLVVSQYLAALRAAAQARAAQSRVDLASALYNQACDLEKNGVGTNLDSVRAHVQLQNEKQALLVSQTRLKTALYGLVQLLHLEPHQTVELGDEMSFFETPEITLEQSIERAYAKRPEIRSLVSQEGAARMRKRGSSESRLPKLTVAGIWSYQGNSAPSAIPVYTYQGSVDFPLFTGGRIRAEAAKADLEIKRIEQEKAQLRDRIALEVKTAVAQLESARNQVDVANLGVDLARREVGQARERFQEGVANNIEVTTAQDALARANDNQIEALYRYNQARADLARAAGQMEDLYAE